MPGWTVCGGKELYGKLMVQGAKNAVLPIMAAGILGGGISRVENCPDLTDVSASLEILRHLGCDVSREDGDIVIDSSNVSESHIPHELMLKMRSSVMYMGAILARTGRVRISAPGGCELGSRPIDLHLKALKALGARVSRDGGEVVCQADSLKGTHINLDFPSVGATENAMLAACAAKGETIITNAAREPEIEDLQLFLRAKGADIEGAGSSVIRINGFSPRSYAVHRVMPDRIVASTYLCAVAAAGGELWLENVVSDHISTVISSLRSMGCHISHDGEGLYIARKLPLRACKPVITKPYPGFPTDAQALMMAASLKAEGTSVFVENIFESRYRHVPEMRRLGADIRTEGRVAMVSGVDELVGAPVRACDLRGGAALIIAALSANGVTEIYDSGHVERGYADIAGDLNRLGANIKRM